MEYSGNGVLHYGVQWKWCSSLWSTMEMVYCITEYSGNGVLHYGVQWKWRVALWSTVEMVYFIVDYTEVPAAILVLD